MTDIESTFKALAVEMRRHVFLRVVEEGGITAASLARELPVTRQAISVHLEVLSLAGLVEHERVGTENHWKALGRPLLEAIVWISGVACETQPGATS